jgi:uncharacterized protein (DUF3820 family)
MKPLEGLSPMPFGKYGPKPRGEGRLMQDVPASYFHYLWINGLREDKLHPVSDYIKRSMSALKKDHPDGIWD